MPNAPASDIYRQYSYKPEAVYGVAPSSAGAQQFRRATPNGFDLKKDTYQSNEIRTDFQIADLRHGVRRVVGKLGGELSCKTYADVFAAVLKRDFTAGASAAGVGLTIAGAGPTYTVTRAAGSYLTDGFKIGDGIRLSVGALNAANINKNLLIVGLTATVATVMTLNGSSLVAEGPIAGCTVAVVGKKTFVPQTSHIDRSFTFEVWYADLLQSELYTGNKFTQVAVNLPPTGIATIDMDLLGQNMVPAAAQYFTSPTPQTTTGVAAAVNGIARAGGSIQANLTGLSMNISAGYGGGPTVGTNVISNLAANKPVVVTGQISAFFDSVAMRDAFINEGEIDILGAFTADNSANSDFQVFSMSRCKLLDAAKSVGDGGIIQTLPFQALLNYNGGAGTATERTTISIQDTQA
ncbi:hypothetical protein H5407_09215 [Mitsuaria sp. WAJ17]|uniref:phage tail tube protein n=1 Tax=Mitsuaria sp. WAJ17 TaxID=2761452 RepID=UPI0016004016|nr:phage tail tube protein [Mitsuaria sp. WAJ17]MBB2485405.1 hypothetical protein [Mitsuaria sp. WAJ17]